MAINAFSNLNIMISDGGTVPSIDYLSKKAYIDIGSGNVLKVSWNTPTALNNAVYTYNIYILSYDSISASYTPLYTANIGNINEFYLKSSLFSELSQSFIPLHIYVEAVSKYGNNYNGISNIAAVAVYKGCGTYIKVDSGPQPIMKRALAFTKLAYKPLVDLEGISIMDSSGNVLYTKMSSAQDDNTGWSLMQEFYSKDSNGAWHSNDLRYEVLVDENGEIVTDLNDEAIYVL